MEFLNQNVFYMMLIPLVLLFLLIITSKSSVEKYFSKEIIEKLKVGNQLLGKNSRNTLFFLVLILFIIALSRPVIDKKEQNVKQSLIPMVIALDVSISMLAQDIYPDRISLAKKKLQQIIENAKNTTIGVVLFAKDSFILSPVTEDFISLAFIVDNLNTKLDFINGSNIFSTLEATKYMLSDYKVKNLIILSDGGNNNEYEQELAFAKKNDIVVYSIGIGTKDGAPILKEGSYITNNSGDIVTVKLNESIKNLSLQSRGGYIDYTLDNSDVTAIINRINIQSKKEELNMKKVKVYTELFYYPLAFGIFLLVIALSSFPNFKRKNSLILLCLLMTPILIPTKSSAYTFNFENIEKATTAYKNKEYKESSTSYRTVNTNNEALYNLGNSLYKEGKYKDAIEIYNKIITTDKELESKKLHNIGNSYVNTKNLTKAKESYEKSLKIKEDKETKENLERVNKELEKKKNKKDQKKKQDKNQKDQKDDKKDQKNKDKNKKDSKKDGNKKENKEKRKDKESEKKDKNSKDKDQKKKEKSTENKSKQKSEKDKKQSESAHQNKPKKDELSDREEKKWMQLLKNQPTPVYMQKVKTNKESSYDENQPW
jgi:Ca-activated chloride channel family protein